MFGEEVSSSGTTKFFFSKLEKKMSDLEAANLELAKLKSSIV